MPLQSTEIELTENVAKIKAGLVSPYVSVRGSTLGGILRSSIMICVSLDAPDKWTNGILENSRYARFSVHSDNKLAIFSGGIAKFRKCTIKSVEDVIERINKYIKENEG